MQETHEVWFQYLGQEDPLEEEMTILSCILVSKLQNQVWETFVPLRICFFTLLLYGNL